jgi:hypothetical protein
VRGQTVWQDGSLSLLYAPRVEGVGPTFASDRDGLNPSFDRTNATDRWMVKGTLELADDVAPEAILYREADRTAYGVNLTRGIGNATTVYVEWAGGRRPPLAYDAYRDAVRSGLFPPGAPFVFGGRTSASFSNDLAAGVTYTFPNKVTATIEYDYHQAGFAASQLRHWVTLGRQANGNATLFDQLWQIRDFADNRQEPLSRQAVFLRAEWQDAFVRDFTLTGLAIVDAYDASILWQLSGNYDLNNRWSAGFTGLVNTGSHASERGSQPQAGSLLLTVIRYF